jgi:hypothetical protein
MSGACPGVVRGSAWAAPIHRRHLAAAGWSRTAGVITPAGLPLKQQFIVPPFAFPARSHVETRHHHGERAKDERMDRRDATGRG